jgi:methenyltetrahydromethanopterin cyclohydrolase
MEESERQGSTKISVNQEAMRLVRTLLEQPDKYGVKISRTSLGVVQIDAGIDAQGGYSAGLVITEICMGGLGRASLSYMRFGDLVLPAVSVYTDHPAVSTLGSQLAGWRVKFDGHVAVGSGPARALALKPKSVFRKIGYRDESSEAVLVLETSKEPPSQAVKLIAESCKVSPRDLYLILVPTASVAGFTQIAGRTAETGIHKLDSLGLDPTLVRSAWSCAPILPVHPDFVESMGRSNDAILYGGVAYYNVYCDDEELLEGITPKAVSSSSKQYGRPFSEIFREAGMDFYKIDPELFAPAQITINNLKTGRVFTAGEINSKVIQRSIGL